MDVSDASFKLTKKNNNKGSQMGHAEFLNQIKYLSTFNPSFVIYYNAKD
jgi:hypothetical protein